MTEPQMPEEARIVIDVAVEGDNINLTVTSRPMIPTLSIAELLEHAAEEIRNGRLQTIQIRPIKPEGS